MAAPFNADAMRALMQLPGSANCTDNLNASLATGATSQAAGLALRGTICRITQSVTGGSCVLPNLSTYEANGGGVLVVNDSPNSINVGGASGGSGAGSFGADKVNGVVTTASFGAGIQAVAAGTAVWFVPSYPPVGVGGVATASPNNWHTFVGTGT